VLLGADPPVTLTRRAAGVLAGLRSDAVGRVHSSGTVISGDYDDLRCGPGLVTAPTRRSRRPSSRLLTSLSLRLRTDLRPDSWSTAIANLHDRLALPEVDDKALSGLKGSDALPRHLAVATWPLDWRISTTLPLCWVRAAASNTEQITCRACSRNLTVVISEFSPAVPPGDGRVSQVLHATPGHARERLCATEGMCYLPTSSSVLTM